MFCVIRENVQQVVEQAGHLPGLAGDDRLGPPAGVVVGLGAFQHVGRVEDRPQRIPQLVREHGQKVVATAHGFQGLFLCPFELPLRLLQQRDVDQRQHHAVDAGLVAVGQDPQQEPPAVAVLHVPFEGLRRIEHAADVLHQRPVLDVVREIVDPPSHVLRQQVEHVGDLRRELADRQLAIEEYRMHFGACQQAVHVGVQLGQLGDLLLVLGVDGIQFLVHRVKLLVGALQLLVRCHQLLVGRLQLLVAGLQLLDRRLQVFLGVAELDLQALKLFVGGLAEVDLGGVRTDRFVEFFDRDQGVEPARAAVADRLDGQVHQPLALGKLHAEPLVDDRGRALAGPLQGPGQGHAEVRIDHLQQVGREPTVAEPQVAAGPAERLHQGPVLVHQQARRHVLLEDRVVDAHEVHVDLAEVRQGRDARGPQLGVGDRKRQAEIGRKSHVPPLAIDLPVGVEMIELVAQLAGALARPENRIPPVFRPKWNSDIAFFCAGGWK